jgi:hypothetical protein
MSQIKIFLVEDDPCFGEVLKHHLQIRQKINFVSIVILEMLEN